MSVALAIDVPPDHPAFAGHFPGNPLLPGALLLDEVLRRLPLPAGMTLQVPVVKFASAALPGDTLRLQYAQGPDGVVRFELRAAPDRLVLGGSVHAGEMALARPA